MVILFHFLRESILSSKTAICHFTFPLPTTEGSPHSSQHLLSVFFTVIIIVSAKWYHIVILIPLSLVASNVEHLVFVFIGYLYIFLFGEISIQILWPFFFIGWFFLLLWSCKGCLYILITSSLSDTWCASIFSHSVVLGSPFSWCPLKHKSFWILKSNLSVFSFIAYAFSVISKKPLPNPSSWKCTLVFSTKHFTVFLTFWISDLCWVNFCIWCEIGVQIHSFVLGYLAVRAPFIGKTSSFPIDWFWHHSG